MRVTLTLQVVPSSAPNEHATDGGFTATVTPTQRKPISWSTDSPLSRGELIDKLTEIGFHLQDIAEALHFADMSPPPSET